MGVNDDDEVIRKVAPVTEKNGKVQTVDSRHLPSIEDMKSPFCAARKARSALMNATKAGNVNASTNAKKFVRVAGAVSKNELVAIDISDLVCGADAPEYLRTRSFPATSDTDEVPDAE